MVRSSPAFAEHALDLLRAHLAEHHLTPETAQTFSRFHPRCGTSFLMVVMLVSLVLFSIVKFDSLLYNFLVRLALVPLVAGLSYEIIRLSAKKESGFVFKLITRPGMWLQNITTQEPDDSQLEVAIEALKESLKLEPQPQVCLAFGFLKLNPLCPNCPST